MEVGQPFIPYKMFRGNVIIPLGLLAHPMPGNAKLLWGMLNYHSGKKGLVYPNQKKLAGRLGVSVRAVRELVNLLEGEGFIEVHRPTGVARVKHLNNSYRFLWHECLNNWVKWEDETPPAAEVAAGAASGRSCRRPAAEVAAPSKRDIARGVPIGSGQARQSKKPAKEDTSTTYRQIWFSEYEKAEGVKYANFTYGGRDGAAFKRIHREWEGDNKRFRRAARAYLADKSEFFEGHPLVNFYSHLTKWDKLGNRPSNGNGQHVPATPKIISINRKVERFTEEGFDHAQN